MKIMAAIAVALLANTAVAQQIDTSVYFAYHQGESVTHALSRKPCSDAAAAKDKYFKAVVFYRSSYGDMLPGEDACWNKEKHTYPTGWVADIFICRLNGGRITQMCQPGEYGAFTSTSSLPKRAKF